MAEIWPVEIHPLVTMDKPLFIPRNLPIYWIAMLPEQMARFTTTNPLSKPVPVPFFLALRPHEMRSTSSAVGRQHSVPVCPAPPPPPRAADTSPAARTAPSRTGDSRSSALLLISSKCCRSERAPGAPAPCPRLASYSSSHARTRWRGPRGNVLTS